MAEDQDQSQKTEEPTEKKLLDAREKGQIASSKEMSSFVMLGVATFLIMIAAPYVSSELKTILQTYLRHAGSMPADPWALGKTLTSLVMSVGAVMAIPFSAFILAAILAAAVQNGVVLSSETIKPKLSKISPLSGLKRLFSLKSLVEFLKNVCKITAAGAIAVAILWPERLRMIVSGRLEIALLSGYMSQLILWVLAMLTVALAVLAGFDYAYQRFEFLKQMRMSRRDIEDEQKQSDGDPKVKQRLRMIRMERARSRMMAEVPKSTVVITNPTHFAVALLYEQGESPAPIVVAKGIDHLALRIREVARLSQVPVIENPPLARALHKSVDIGAIIPEQHFQAVAEVIGFVMRNKPSKPGGR